MFEAKFSDELAKQNGSKVEIATNTNLQEGIIIQLGPIIIGLQITGYGIDFTLSISLGSINFVRIPSRS